MRCPEDVSIVGFDNLEMVDLLQPALTTVQQPVYRIGATAAELLIERISGASKAPREIVLETELIRRGSVMRVQSEAPQRQQEARSRSARRPLAGERKTSSASKPAPDTGFVLTD
jgi:LacI family transcriptional regulator